MNRYKYYSLGLIGYPLEHSLSPDLHLAALHAMDIEGEYKLFPIPPLPEGADSLAALVERVRQGVLHGINVTIPHKQNVLNFLSHLTPSARAIGAVNTIFSFNGELIGDNTDAPGFLMDLERFAQDEFETLISGQDHKSNPQRALVLGAGGGARAVAYALLDAGWNVIVAARKLPQAQSLVNDLRKLDNLNRSSRQVQFHADVPRRIAALRLSKSEIQKYLQNVDEYPIHLVINATPLGMWPHTNGNPWPEGLPLPGRAVVYDLVYNPAETALVRASWDAGLKATSGLGMLVEQAALSLEKWIEAPVPRGPMWASVPEFVLYTPTNRGLK